MDTAAYTIFKNCNLLDVQNKELRTGMSVLVKDNIIIEVTSGKFNLASAAMVYDLGDKTLMPGLIDAHVHVTASKMNLANQNIPESEVAIIAASFMEKMLLRGFTSIRDAGGADIGLANVLANGLVKGPRLFYSGRALSQTGGHGDFRAPTECRSKDLLSSCACSGSNISILADGVAEVRKAAREQIRQGATQIKVMASGGVASPTDRITNLQYSIEELRAIVEEANNAGIYVMAHAYTPDEIIRCVESGVRTIEHGNLLNEIAAKKMAEHHAYLVPTLVTYHVLGELGASLGFPPESIAKINDVKQPGLNAIKIAKQYGVKIGFGSDLLSSDGQLHQSREFMIRAQIEPIFDIIHSATYVNAEILNQENKLGIIAPGAFADLLVVNGNPLENVNLLLEQGKYLSLIMKNGVIYKNQLI